MIRILIKNKKFNYNLRNNKLNKHNSFIKLNFMKIIKK